MPEISFKRILLHPATLFVGCVILTVVGTVTLWEQNSKHFLKSHKYDLTPDRIIVQGPREDLAEQLKAQIISELADTNPNTLDTELVSKVALIAESQPYVQTSSIEKSVSSLNITADFRHPVAIVELGQLPIAIDSEGVVLDGRIYNMQTPDDFLRISIAQPVSQGLNSWEVWPDVRIQAAAKICNELDGVWQEFGLFRVVSYWQPGQSAKQTDVFELWTQYGDKIIWSNATESQSAVTPEQKIALIRNFIAENGSLEKLAGRNKLDVRSGKTVLLKDIRTAARNRLLLSKLQDYLFSR